MKINKLYHLEKYRGRGTRHECPRCHDAHSFTYYVDEDGNILDKTVGRCNHESSCGYHYTPKDWFRDNPQVNQGYRSLMPKPVPWHDCKPKQAIIERPDIIPFDYVRKSQSDIYDNNLSSFLLDKISRWEHKRVLFDYHIGTTRNQAVIYWQIDINGDTRTGKVIQYDPNTGHRVKSMGADWIHAIMKRRGQLPDSFNMVQCLFGEHLLRIYPDKPVILVEAEKTAVVGSCLYPQYNWLATGGKSQLSEGKLAVLKGRKVRSFPDVDGYDYWKMKEAELMRVGVSLNVSDILATKATEAQKLSKIDIADLMLDYKDVHPDEEVLMEWETSTNRFRQESDDESLICPP